MQIAAIPGFLYVNPSNNPAKQVRILLASAAILALALDGKEAEIPAWKAGNDEVDGSGSFAKYKAWLAEHAEAVRALAAKKAAEKATAADEAQKFLDSLGADEADDQE